ncbi:MAG: hypothetical protein KC944_22685 [Candidatus Omnitrophica bacterium]|nr:hypothetical protein [Candidatus Omnitrophota bacterium]
MLGSQLKFPILMMCLCALVISAPFAYGAKSDESGDTSVLFGNHLCPISGDPVDPETFAVYEDADNHVYGRIYTCCGGCVKKAEANAAELYKKYYLTDENGKKVDPVDLKNEKCPISGHDVTDAGTIEYNGLIVHHCCAKCPAKFLENPDENLAKLAPDELKEKYEMKE